MESRPTEVVSPVPLAATADERSDLLLLKNLCTEEVAALRDRAERDERRGLRSDVYWTEAFRFEDVAEWLDGLDKLPEQPWEYPCVLCDAKPEDACELDGAGRYHYGRGFTTAITLRSRDLSRQDDPAQKCLPSAETGPGRAYRGVCVTDGCYVGPVRDGEAPAVEDAMDHAFPGWRVLPVVPRMPEERKAREKWFAQVKAVYPDGWLERGGPFRTRRSPMGTRHHPEAGLPLGNWDMSAGDTPETALLPPAPQGQLTIEVAPMASRQKQLGPSTRASKPVELGMDTLF